MGDRAGRADVAVDVSMSSGAGMDPSVGVAAPIGAVSRKDLRRAGRTSVRQEGASGLVLAAALPGSVRVQRRRPDGAWETLETRRASRLGRTRMDLPGAAHPPRPVRVVFSPKNDNIPSWISPEILR